MRDITQTLASLLRALEGSRPRKEKFREVAEIVREAGGYRWVGLYEVTAEEIAVVAWSGPEEPAHLRIPMEQGLCGAAVRGKESVVVGDVAADARYLSTLPSTRSEILVPILDTIEGKARGVIDVESDRLDAFGEEDRVFLEHCAAELGTAMSPSPG